MAIRISVRAFDLQVFIIYQISCQDSSQRNKNNLLEKTKQEYGLRDSFNIDLICFFGKFLSKFWFSQLIYSKEDMPTIEGHELLLKTYHNIFIFLCS